MLAWPHRGILGDLDLGCWGEFLTVAVDAAELIEEGVLRSKSGTPAALMIANKEQEAGESTHKGYEKRQSVAQ